MKCHAFLRQKWLFRLKVILLLDQKNQYLYPATNNSSSEDG